MRRNAGQWIAVSAFAAVAIMVGASVAAEEEGGQGRRRGRPGGPEVGRRGGPDGGGGRRGGPGGQFGPKDEAVREFMKEHMKARHEHFKAQHEENMETRESMKDATAQEACKAIIAQHKAQHSENQTFMTGQFKEFITFISAHMDEKGVSEEDQQKRLDEMEERHTSKQAEHQERSDKLIDTLTELSQQEDLTKEELHAAMRKLHPRPGPGRGGPGMGGRRGRGPGGPGKGGCDRPDGPRKGGRRGGPDGGEAPEQV